ncbi:MAG: Fic family protein [Candidatus Paceibacterota bacterium]|jgi:Fic family protein
MKNTFILKRIEDKLVVLKKARPFPPYLVNKLREQFSIEMNYNSNAIEGNTLTLRETMLVLQQGITVKGKSLKDHLEVKNQAKAIEYLYEVVNSKKDIPLSEMLIRNLHSLVVQNIDGVEEGSYRTYDVRITGSKHNPPPAFEVSHRMKDLLDWYKENKNKLDIITLATEFKHRFVYIHPFSDGNGRVSRIILNIILMKLGYPIVVILKNDRAKYYKALQKADKGKIEDLILFVSQAVERSLDLYIKAIKNSTKENTLLPLSKIASQTKYGAEYLGLLVRTGKIAGVKEGRNWKTSLDAIQRYEMNLIRKSKKKS